MIVFIVAGFIIAAVILSAVLVAALRKKNAAMLFAFDALIALGSILSGYLALLAWEGRDESENWEMLGFAFITAPFAVLSALFLIAQLIVLRRWETKTRRPLQFICAGLLGFLILQLIIGIASG